MTEPLARHGGLAIRLAGPGDDAALRRLLADVPAPGRPSVAHEREPGFFALLRLHGGHAETLVAEAPDGSLAACGSLVVRPGAVEGALEPVAHVGDLRIRPRHRGGGLLAAMGGLAFRRARDLHGVRVGCSAALASNRRLRGAVAARGARRAAQPPGRRVGAYDMATLVLPPAPRRSRLDVSPARPPDVDEAGAFLQRAALGQPFGYDLSPQALRRRLQEWPGLGLADLRLVRRDGVLVGCAAPWDPSPVRQARVRSWGLLAPTVAWLDFRRARQGLGPLPGAGEHLRLAYLTHLHVADDDPAVFAALLEDAWAWSARRGLHGVAAMVPAGSGLGAGLPGGTSRTRVHVHAIALRDAGSGPALRGRPGLEMAIA